MRLTHHLIRYGRHSVTVTVGGTGTLLIAMAAHALGSGAILGFGFGSRDLGLRQ
jgi:hypothetical protein